MLSLQVRRCAHPRHAGYSSAYTVPRRLILCRGGNSSKCSRVVELLDTLPDKDSKQVAALRMVAELEQDLIIAQKDAEVAQKDAEVAIARKDLQYQQLVTQNITVELLFVRGLLHARGAIEYAEEKYFKPRSGIDQRWQKWDQILCSRPDLLAKAQGCFRNTMSAKQIANKIAGVYDNLSGHIHQGSRTAVDIVEGPLNKEQMRLLKCIAEEAGARVNMIYRAESVVTSSDESESGVDDSDVPLGSE